MEELEARVEALCRRRYGVRETVIKANELEIDLSSKEARLSGELFLLKPREYRILEYLAIRKGEVVTRTEIEIKIYGDAMEVQSNTIESGISSIRRKFAAADHVCPIQTRVGLGYIFVD